MWPRGSEAIQAIENIGAGEGIRTPDPNLGKYAAHNTEGAFLRHVDAKWY
jgi:hypothetical protein